MHTPPSGPVYPVLHVHAALSLTVLYVVAGHVVHTTPSGPVNPVLQIHTPLSLATLFVFAGHTVHTPPSGPVYPVLHLHTVFAELALGTWELFVHVRHAVALVTPAVTTYFPVVQLVHTVWPVVILYVPVTHAAHGASVNPATHGIVDTHASWCVVY